MDWYDKAAQQIEEDYDEGYMSYKEYKEKMSDLDAEYEQARENAAQNACDSY